MSDPDLAALVASRICHDLVGPMGAIANGVELLGLTGGGEGSETALIAESAAEANARLKFMRLALGKGEGESAVAARELREILAALATPRRLTRRWRPGTDPSRAEARAVLLSMMCLETALPAGGTITAEHEGEALRLEAEGPRLAAEGALWDGLADGAPPSDITAAQVEFALLPGAVANLGRDLALERGAGRVAISF